MNDKIYIVISFLVITIVLEFVGASYIKSGRQGTSQVQGAATYATEAVVQMCKNYFLDKDPLIQVPEKPRSVTKCGKYYRMEPPTVLPNAPSKMVDGKGQVVAICGGMSLTGDVESFEQKECEISCGLENLCNVQK